MALHPKFREAEEASGLFVPQESYQDRAYETQMYFPRFIGGKWYKAANQTVANGNNDAITFGSATTVYQELPPEVPRTALHDNTNSSRFKVPTGYHGYWRYTIKVAVDAVGTQHARVVITVVNTPAGPITMDGIEAIGHGTVGGWGIHLCGTLEMLQDEYIEFFFSAVDEAHDIQGGSQSETSVSWHFLGRPRDIAFDAAFVSEP